MSNRKPHNSILVLATLGVYLGLVLVGATPQILAQAAMTKQFNVKDEVEVKDDLDKKPDDEGIDAFLNDHLESALSALVEDLKKLKCQGKYRSKGKKSSIISTSQLWSAKDVGVASSMAVETRDPNDWILDSFLALHWKYGQPAFTWKKVAEVPAFFEFPANVEKEDHLRYYCFDTKITPTDFVIRHTFSRATPQSAVLFAERLNQIFLKRASNRPGRLTKQIYEYTRASSEKNRVLIVTRLPRAGLDSLLASSAK